MIEILELSLKHEELEKKVLPLLKGSVFHTTDQKGYQGIINDGEIRNNKKNCLGKHHTKSYGIDRGYICLINLKNIGNDLIDEALLKYYFLNYGRKRDVYFFILKNEEHYQLIGWEQARTEVNFREMYVPYVECWYPRNISLDKIEKIIAIHIEEDEKTMALIAIFAKLRLMDFDDSIPFEKHKKIK